MIARQFWHILATLAQSKFHNLQNFIWISPCKMNLIKISQSIKNSIWPIFIQIFSSFDQILFKFWWILINIFSKFWWILMNFLFKPCSNIDPILPKFCPILLKVCTILIQLCSNRAQILLKFCPILIQFCSNFAQILFNFGQILKVFCQFNYFYLFISKLIQFLRFQWILRKFLKWLVPDDDDCKSNL